jgi:PAS domain S-box-containing protein
MSFTGTSSMSSHTQLPSALIGPEGFFATFAEPLLIVDEAWRIVYANPAAEKIFGKPSTSLQGTHPWVHWPATLQSDVERKHRLAHDLVPRGCG